MFAAIDSVGRASDLVVQSGLVSDDDVLDQLRERELLLMLEQDQRD